MPSFDIVSKTDMTSVDNALQGVVKEMQVRYDFKGSKSEISKEGETILIIADDDLKRRQVEELLLTHLTRKGVDTAALEFGKTEQAGGNTVRQTVATVWRTVLPPACSVLPNSSAAVSTPLRVRWVSKSSST